jgi:hypothetical protein
MMMIVEKSMEYKFAGKPKYSEKTCPSATLSTTNLTWPDTGLNAGRRGGKPTTTNKTTTISDPQDARERSGSTETDLL